MKKNNILLVCFMISIFFFQSEIKTQDYILKPNGDEIKAKVIEITDLVIKYKKFEYLDGPIYTINRKDVFLIKYENGSKDIINSLENSEKNNVQQEIISSEKTKKKYNSTTISLGISSIFGGYGLNFEEESYNDSYFFGGPISIRINKTLSDHFSLVYGSSTSAFFYKSKSSISESQSTHLITAAIIGANYHIPSKRRADPYVGVIGGLGYWFTLKSTGYPTYYLNGGVPIYSINVGVNFLNKNKNGWNLELGYDIFSFLKVGYIF